MQLLCLEVLENDGEVVFLKRIKQGASQNSYGLHVAKLAGVPSEVVNRSKELLVILQKNTQMQQESLVANSVQLCENGESAEEVENAVGVGRAGQAENIENVESEHQEIQIVEKIEDFTNAQKNTFIAPGLFSDEELILDEILSINPEEITPIQALQKLSTWKNTLQGK